MSTLIIIIVYIAMAWGVYSVNRWMEGENWARRNAIMCGLVCFLCMPLAFCLTGLELLTCDKTQDWLNKKSNW